MPKRMNLWWCVLILLAACAAPTVSIVPTATGGAPTFPPTWTPTLGRRGGTQSPTVTPRPTSTLSPIVTPAASQVYTSTDGALRLEVPANWEIRAGQLQLINRQSQQMQYVSLASPGTPPQPAVLIFYGWPAAGAIDNDTAWEQAFAVASLAVKVCPMVLTSGGAITVGGEAARYMGYLDSCGVQGEIIGLVHAGVNYGVLLEAPQSVWADWQPRLRAMLQTLVIDGS